MDPIQATNFAYLLLALCMYSRNEPRATLVVIVFFVSYVHHLYPEKQILQRLDGTIANICLLLIVPLYFSKKQKTWQYWLSCETFALSLYFYVMSGNDFTSRSYLFNHSMWHVTSALALSIMLFAPDKERSTIISTRESAARIKSIF